MAQVSFTYKKNDEYYTPKYAVEPLLKIIKPSSVIWCPFDKDESNFVKLFKDNGHTVINGHISTGQDFFEAEVPECDYIISNPPYSLKTEILEKLFASEKPFAMLLNLQGIFDSKKRIEMFSKNKFELLFLYPRVEYSTPECDRQKGVPFQSAYVCHNMLDKQIEFTTIQKR